MQKNQKNPLNELIINIVLPTLILNKGGAYLGANGATKALIIALAFPAVYAIYDLVRYKNKNVISILGFVSLLFTGGFGLLQLEGQWFAIKEAAFPLIIGLVVLVSAYTAKPLIGMLIYNDSIMQTDKVKGALESRGTMREFDSHLKKSTVFFSFSFFFSALLNYILAMRIFTDIPTSLPSEQRSEILNQQIADMTWLGYVVILVPSMIIMGAIMWHLFSGIKKYTGYSFNEVLKDAKP